MARLQCEALTCCSHHSKDRGKRCSEQVTHMHNGIGLCWTHHKAAENAARMFPLELAPEARAEGAAQ